MCFVLGIMSAESKQLDADNMAYLIHSINPKLSIKQSSQYKDAILAAADKYDIDEKLLASIIAVETKYNNHLVGSLGELGLAQIRPEMHCLGIHSYAKRIQYLKNPSTNIDEAAKILRDIQNKAFYRYGDMRWVEHFNRGLGKSSKKFRYYHKVMQYYRMFNQYEL